MKFVIEVHTLVYLSSLILFESSPSNCQCNSERSIEMTAYTDDSYERYLRKICKTSNNRKPSIIQLRNESVISVPKNILQQTDTEMLDLRDNKLVNLPFDIVNFTKLGYVNLKGNRITDILFVSVLNYLPKLESVVLSHNPMKSLRGLRTKNLRFLEAEYCEITDITDRFLAGLPSLLSLNLTGNPLVTVRKLKSNNLTDLVLKYCHLTHLADDAFAGLSNLQILNLHGNKLITMPDKIFSHNNNLISLSLSNNTFRKMKNSWFVEKPHMRSLDLAKNSLQFINETIFYELSELTDLNLGKNKFVSMPTLKMTAIILNLTNNLITNRKFRDLSNMTRLRSLDLSHNRLHGNCVQLKSTSLRILNLGYNNITRITKESLSGVPNLMDLNLQGNQLRDAIDPVIFSENKILVDIELDDNPWDCNCTQLYETYIYLAAGQKTTTTSLSCVSPDYAKGKTWWDFCTDDWKKIMVLDDPTDVSKTWLIAISSIFFTCLILGSIIYIAYTIKKNHAAINS